MSLSLILEGKDFSKQKNFLLKVIGKLLTTDKIKIGISSCLLGEKVRFDGQHKYHWYINEVLEQYFEYISICPEVAIGMGIPRKSVRLVGNVDSPEMIEPGSGKNWTKDMHKYNHRILPKLSELSGYLFKKGSPSCGVFRTKVYQDNGIPLPHGQGIFAKAFVERYPLIPIEDEGRLNDAQLRENFIKRVFAYHRLKIQMDKKFKRSDWIKFHEQSKYLLLSHSRTHYSTLGNLVANMKHVPAKEFKSTYAKAYMETFKVKSTRKKNMDVLLHILGFMKTQLNSLQKKDLLQVIQSYREGTIPLIVPVTLLSHYIRVFDIAYIKDQYYLNPHPYNLSLRNNI